jgi:hypothetical protein
MQYERPASSPQLNPRGRRLTNPPGEVRPRSVTVSPRSRRVGRRPRHNMPAEAGDLTPASPRQSPAARHSRKESSRGTARSPLHARGRRASGQRRSGRRIRTSVSRQGTRAAGLSRAHGRGARDAVSAFKREPRAPTQRGRRTVAMDGAAPRGASVLRSLPSSTTPFHFARELHTGVWDVLGCPRVRSSRP